MKRQITFRLLAMLLTASLLLSSTGLLSMLAKAEEVTTAPTLVTQGGVMPGEQTSEPQTTLPESESTTREPGTTQPPTTNAPETTSAPETTTTPPTTTKPAANSDPTLVTEGGKLELSGPQVNAEGFKPGPAPQAETWLGVDGTTTNMGKASNPYNVSDASHFLEIQTLINNTMNADKYFRLTADINLASVTIANYNAVAGFSASLICLDPALAVSDPTKIFINLDGNNFKIRNLNITNTSKDTCALFGYLSANSDVYGINFENCSLTVPYQNAQVSAVVAVQNMGLIRNCSFAGSTSVTTLDMSSTQGPASAGETYTLGSQGGNPGHIVRVGSAVFVGDNQGTIEACKFSDISVHVNRRTYVGGVAGQNSGTITGIKGSNLADCGIKGVKITVVGNTGTSSQIGGITGRNRAGATVSDSTLDLAGANAFNSFTNGNKVGGVAGVNEGTVANCYVLGKVKNTQTVTASSYNMLGYRFIFGGITGENKGNINNSSAENIGMFFSNTQDAVYGGITGINSGNGTTTGLISACYASGKQSDPSFITSAGYFAGGIIGDAEYGALLSNCYALVSLSPNLLRAGALIGNGAQTSMFSTVSPNHWSSIISGWPTQSALDSSDSNDVYRNIKVLNLATNASATLSKASSFAHSWGNAGVGIDGIGTASAFSESSANLSISESTSSLTVTGGPFAGTFGYLNYTLNVALPVGVGATVQPTVQQQMSIAVITTAVAPTGSPIISPGNPVVINNAMEILFIRNIPYTNYKLAADITMPTVSPNEWRTSVFSGTLDGNGKTITSHIPVFSKIYGSRDTTVPIGGGNDTAANLASGYVFNLNLVLSANTKSGMLGTLIGGTVKNTTLTGSSAAVALTINLAGENSRGGLLDTLYGNSYVYGCFTDLKVDIQISGNGNIGGLIGHIEGNKVTVENCGSNADVYSVAPITTIASLIGKITTSTGTVKDCFASGLVQRGGFIAVGSKLITHRLENLYWSIKDTNTANQATVLPADNINTVGPNPDTVYKWSFDESVGFVSDDDSYLNIILPSGITRMASAQPAGFTVTVRDSGVIVVGTLAIQGGKLSIKISKDALATLPIDTILTVVHNSTGMRSRVQINDGISKDANGYYQVKKPSDLQFLSTRQIDYLADGVNFKIKLMNDIDMYDAVNAHQYEYTPMGNYDVNFPANNRAFKGVFEGNGFAINNLLVSGTDQVAIFAYTSGATISNLTLDNAEISTDGKYIACIAAVANAGSIENITIRNSTITSTYSPGGGQSYTGGIVGSYVAGEVNPATINNITIDNLSISVPGAGYAGGLVGNIESTTVAINAVTLTDLNLTGTQRLGGVVGSQAGNVTISNVSIGASLGSTPQISGNGFIGGVVGYSFANALNSKITACTVTGMGIINIGTSLYTGATGGIAGWFSGTVGDDPATTGITEECIVMDCTIKGMYVGGIVGRADTSTGNLSVTLKNCKVDGATSITAPINENNAAAGGIFGDYNVGGTLAITRCYVYSDVTVTNGKAVGGILGTGSLPGLSQKLVISDCQSFAAVSSPLATSYAGAIIGIETSSINGIKIINCVAGGTVSAVAGAGGLVGYHFNTSPFNITTAGNTPFITGSYVTAIINGPALSSAKIVGLFQLTPPTIRAVNNTTIHQAINFVVLSSYPQDLAAYSFTLPNAYLSFGDVNRPDVANPTFFQHGSASTVILTDTNRTATVTASNLPKGKTAGFSYVAASGWVSETTDELLVTGYTATVIDIEAINSSSSTTGVVAEYENSGVDIYPSGTAEKLSFLARIPVFCDNISFNWIGSGTQADPFKIKTQAHLNAMRSNILQDETAPNPIDYFGGYYRLENDIYLVGDFSPITGGPNDLAFVGTLDGNGHSIRGLRISNGSDAYVGLFKHAGKQTVELDGVATELTATFQNLKIFDAVVVGNINTTHGGILVGIANNTLFTGIEIENASLSNVAHYAGGIVGEAIDSIMEGFLNPDYEYLLIKITNVSVKLNDNGFGAGGVAGRFGNITANSGGYIGNEGYGTWGGWEVIVSNTVVEGSNAGGIVGYNYLLPVTINAVLVSGGSVTSKTTSDSFSAGGILGRVFGVGDHVTKITNAKVDGTTVTAVCIAGGIIGSMAMTPVVLTTKLLTLNRVESYAAVSATGTVTSVAGGIVGIMTNALVVGVGPGVAGGSVQGNKIVGGIIGLIDGTDTSLALTNLTSYFVANFVVSAAIAVKAGASVGLLLGFCNKSLMPDGFPYAITPFENIKYSSYQYTPGRLIIGNSLINNSPDFDLMVKMADLNKGFYDTWIDPTYMGLRYENAFNQVTLNVILGDSPIPLTPTNVLLPVFPGNYGYGSGTNDFTNFTDVESLNFELTGVTSTIPGLVSYDLNNNILTKNTGQEGVGELVFQYENGLRLALKVIAFDDLDGSGISGDPFIIRKTSHFDLIRLFPSGYFVQGQDITFAPSDFTSGGTYFNEGKLWEPLKGSGTEYFSGSYNGNDHKISGFKISRQNQNFVGFFAKLDPGASVSNLTLENADIIGQNYVGTLAGEVSSNADATVITNVHVLNANVSSTSALGDTNTPTQVGGLVAVSKTTLQAPVNPSIIGCSVTSAIVSTANLNHTFAGGIVASFQKIENCTADYVTVTAGLYAGGIAARSSIVSGGPGWPVSIKNCTVENVSGTSAIRATYGGASAAAGILAIMSKNIQLTVENCQVPELTVVSSPIGAAGGILGALSKILTSDLNMQVTIKNSKSYANVTGANEAGGIIGAIKVADFDLSKMLVAGCVGGGNVEVTSVSPTFTGVGGIIGAIKSTGGAPLGQNDELIINCIASAALKAPVAVTKVGKLVGICGPTLTAWTQSGSPNAFKDNFISTYPQEKPVFGDATMMSDPGINLVFTDLMECETATTTEPTFTVRDINIPGSEFSPVAITIYNETTPVTTQLNAHVKVWKEDTGKQVELTIEDSVIIKGFEFGIQNVSITTQAAFSWAYSGSGQSRLLNMDITPSIKRSGFLEVALGYGLQVSVPMLTFAIDGIGTIGNPFKIENAEQLTLMYYLPNVNYVQISDIAIVPEDFNEPLGETQAAGVLYNPGYVGFMPIGTAAKPFTGSYNGQEKRITGLYSNNKDIDYIGFFGHVDGVAELKNIHIELRENTVDTLGGMLGAQYVGGLVGRCSSSGVIIENCSVAYAQVAGKQAVGGLVGQSYTSINKCFTNCDVIALGSGIYSPIYAGKAGGLIGHLYNASTVALTVNNSFATGSVYSDYKNAGGLIGLINAPSSATTAVNVTDCFFTGSVKAGTAVGEFADAASVIIGSGTGNIGRAQGSRVLVAGTNISFKAGMSPFAGSILGTRTNIYYDNSVLGFTTNETGTILQNTAQLTGATLPAGLATPTWTAVSGSYPRLVMADSYSNAFCAMATIPLNLDANELKNSRTLKDGLRFQPAITNTVAGAAITFKSSKLDLTDSVAYPTGYDPLLYGNNGDRSIDLLFKNNNNTTTTIYRNIFRTDAWPVVSGGVNPLQNFNVERGEVLYDCKTPVVLLEATVNGTSVFKRVKLPLENLTDHYYIATERQLRAVSSVEATGKFSVFGTVINRQYPANARVHLTANVNLYGNLSGRNFTPIQNFKGKFNGNEFAIKGLKINLPSQDDMGLFKKLEGDNVGEVVEINNLSLEDAQITGKNNVGALAGRAVKNSEVNNCSVYASGETGALESFVKGTERVGGLVGFAENISIKIGSQSRSAVPVEGTNSVGGFVGMSTAIINNCFATGPVTAVIEQLSAGGSVNVLGVGGFAGAVTGGAATLSFATGNVTVNNVITFVNISQSIGIGGFVGLLSGLSTDVSGCFASGAVRAESVGDLKMAVSGSLSFGIGGVAGINQSQLTSCYSSSTVYAHYIGDVLGTTGIVRAGLGGVSGIAQAAVSDTYSSGSVLRDMDKAPQSSPNTIFVSAIGGVIGTVIGSLTGYAQLYFDIWNNSYGSTLTAIGGVADTVRDIPAGSVGGLTTDEMCISQVERNTPGTLLQLSTGMWSFNAGAYPCLLALVQPGVSDYIRYPAVLSVVAVAPDSRDISARTGNGITMAITTPASLTVLGVLYELEWSAAEDSDVSFIKTDVVIDGNTLNKFTPVRTANASQILSLIAEIKNKTEFGSRRFERLCAEMRGTPTKPYLISHKSDLQHIGLPTYTEYQVTGFDGYYNQWYSPLNDSLVNVAGIVHFKLLSDIDMRLDVNYTYNSGEDRLDVVVNSAGDGNRDNDNHHIPYLTNASYNGIIFEGISFAGNDYSIDYFKSAREFIFGISSVSTISDISFENLQIDSTGTVDEDLGTALVRYNQGTIDGCMILSGDIKGGNNVASIVVNNQATLKNSTVKASITGKANVGGIVTSNLAGGTITNCAFDDGLITVNQTAGADAKAGAIAGSNSGTISNCFSMGSIVSTNYANVIGGLVGENTSTGIIGPAYSRTHVSGGDIIGGFVGTNAGTITNAFSAGRVTLSSGYTQTDIFCGTNTGTLTDTFADKAMAGKSTYALLDDVTTTQELMDMTCFSTTGTASNVFTESSTESAYPQLTAILALDNGYATGAYIPQKFELLIGYSILSSAAIKTKYSQYIDTLALSTANPVSTITTTESWLTDVSWSTNDLSIIDAEGLTTATSGSTTLTASITINASNGKTHPITMPIAVTTGDQNLNFNGGDGRTDTPYQINSTDSFSSLAYYGPNPEISYVLTNDINYDDGCPNPVITTFSGTLDGAQHVVYDLTLDADSAGLFGHLNGATVSNLGLVGAKKITVAPGNYAGLLAGLAQGATITNCYAIGEINTNAAHIGGLVGAVTVNTTITGCMTSGKFVNTSTDSEANTGSIAGSADLATINESFSTAYVLGKGVVGGIVGEAINTSVINGCTFAGMVMDSTLAGGASAPSITTIGNIAGKSEDSTITGCTYDKQISLITDANATAKFTGELMTGSAYTVHTGLAGGSDKFAAGVAFGTMPIRFLLGSSAGSTQSFSKISLPGTIAGDAISVVEIPQHTEAPLRYHLSIGTGSPIIINLLSNLDLADVYAGIEIKLDTVNGSVFSSMANNVLRYTQPRLNRIVTVSYTLANSSGDGGLDGETVAVMLKNTHLFAGDPVTYSSDAFTNVTQSLISPALFENLVVSSGGIYAGGNLPKGYAYQITASDQDNNTLPVTIMDGEYGTYVALKDDTTGIKLSYTIIKNEPWGVYVYWTSLVNALVI